MDSPGTWEAKGNIVSQNDVSPEKLREKKDRARQNQEALLGPVQDPPETDPLYHKWIYQKELARQYDEIIDKIDLASATNSKDIQALKKDKNRIINEMKKNMTEEEAFGLAYVTQVDDPSDPEIEMAAELYAKVGDLLEKWGIVKEFSKELKIYSAGWYSYLDIIKGWDGFFECQGIRVGLDVKGGPEQALFGEVRVSKFQQPKRSLDRNKYMDWLMDMAMPAAEEISAKLRISKEAA